MSVSSQSISQPIQNGPNETEDDQMNSIKAILPLQILLEEMRQPLVAKRVNSIKQLSSISIALGHEKTRALLIPFMGQLMCDEEDIQKEILFQLPGFVNLVGGSYHAHLLMDIAFECLYKCDEGPVKEAALNSLKDLFRRIDVRHFEKLLIDFINRILENDHFRAKEIALTLMPEIFIAISEEYQLELLNLFTQMSQDATPMVRKTVAMKLKDFAKLIPPAPEQQLLEIFDRLLSDENDYVRLPLIESLMSFSQVCLEKSNEEFVVILNKLVADKSSKVRATLVDFVQEASQAFSPEIFSTIILPTYLSFLNPESENELKNRCLQNIIPLYTHIPDFSKLFLPKIKVLAKDKSLSVRSSLGDAVVLLLTEGKRENLEGIEEVFAEILDESDNDTKFKLFKKIKDFGHLQENLSKNIISKILLSLQSITENKKWRMRSYALTVISRIVQESSIPSAEFDQQFLSIIKTSLSDNTAEVRLEAAKTVGQLVAQFKGQFAQDHIFPEILKIWEHPNYLMRISALFSLKYSIPHLEDGIVKDLVLKNIQKAFEDPVVNIRLAGLDIAKLVCSSTGISQITKSLCVELVQKMKNDKEAEVRSNANVILKL